MSDAGRASRAALARLRREVAVDREAMRERVLEVKDVRGRWTDGPPERPWLAVAAVALHAWYTGLEAALERIAREVDGEVPAGEASHRGLLSQAATQVPGLRPAIVDPTLEADLAALLGFRHFFRHAYGVRLDPGKLSAELDRLLRVAPQVEQALDAFDGFLAEAARQLD